MAKILFLYSTREGQTQKILQHIATQFDGDECDFLNIHDMPIVDITHYDKVLVGASIRYGRLNKKLYQYIEKNCAALSKAKSAFICVNLTARKEQEGKDTPEGSIYIKTFLKKSPWQPQLIGVFAGALLYPHYKFIDKMMIKFIMKLTGGETDTRREIEYTNWEKVNFFGSEFKNL